jgi:hypothetical protein
LARVRLHDCSSLQCILVHSVVHCNAFASSDIAAPTSFVANACCTDAEGSEVGALVDAAEVETSSFWSAFKTSSCNVTGKHRLAHITIFNGARLLSQLGSLQRQNVIPITNPPVTNEAMAASSNPRQRNVLFSRLSSFRISCLRQPFFCLRHLLPAPRARGASKTN